MIRRKEGMSRSLSIGIPGVGCFGFVLSSGLLMLAWSQTVHAEDRQAVMPKEHAMQLFKTHCFDCHDSAGDEAGVNLEDISYEVSSDVGNAALWQKILNAINSGEMPPPDETRIPDDLKLSFLEDLTAQMVTARMVLGDSGGVIPLRRLNRREYANTIEALVGIRPDITTLPDDQTGAGFDTQGASLFMSSDQIEQYINTGRDVLERCLKAARRVKSSTVRVEPEEKYTEHYTKYLAQLTHNFKNAVAYQSQSEKPPSAFGILDPHQAEVYISHYKQWRPQLEEYLKRPENKTGAALIMTIKAGGMTQASLPVLQPHQPGRYKVRVRAAMYPDADSRYHYLEFNRFANREAHHLGWQKVTAPLESPEILEFEYIHPPGEKTNLRLHQRTHQDRGDKGLWTRAMYANGIGLPPGIWIDWVELVGPEPIDAPQEAKQLIFPPRTPGASDADYARTVIKGFAKRAFRGKQPSEAFVDKLVGQFEFHHSAGREIEPSLVEAMALVLASPEFLYMINDGRNDLADSAEADSDKAGKSPKQLSAIELAVRLSYMLWSAPPDEELMQLARRGTLDDPNILRSQTQRLLNDPRTDRFIRDFTHQWLDMGRLGMFQFNGLVYPNFDNAVRENAREEIFQSVIHLQRNDLPLGNLLDANYVMINDVLADFYGIDGVQGSHFRPVPVETDSPRGGLMGTAAVAAMGSDGLKASPVERGVWVLRHLLHDAPAPAPPNVPQLSRFEGEPRSARSMQKLHQEEPQCAQCHRKIDPIGYGLDHFAADGTWRWNEEILSGSVRERDASIKTVAFEIDASGTLPTGETFNDYFELRSQIGTKQDAFTRGFIEELIAYGLGRPYGFSDELLAESMMTAAQEKHYTISAIVHELVQSIPFQSK